MSYIIFNGRNEGDLIGEEIQIKIGDPRIKKIKGFIINAEPDVYYSVTEVNSK